MSKLKKVFQYQIWHVLSLLALLYGVYAYYKYRLPAQQVSSFWGIDFNFWFWSTISVPIVHQIYVSIVWRVELYYRTFTRKLGIQKAFQIYAVGFFVFFVSRFIFIALLSRVSQNSLPLKHTTAYVFALFITPFVLYLFYSVKKYFTIKRAFGFDHFDPNYSEPFVKKGIFRYTNNGMYIFGLSILYIPGLVWLSEPAIVAALFNHLYIWVHYFTTEKPDMQVIYGKAS